MANLAGLLNVNCDGGNSGGGINIWVAKQAQVTDFTLTGEEYTAVTMSDVAELFVKYEFQENSAEFKEVVTRENGSMKVVDTVEFYSEKMTTAQRTAIQELMDESQCGLIIIFEDSNGIKWVIGYGEKFGKSRRAQLQTSEAGTGKNLTDPNGASILLDYETTEKARVFTGTVPEA